MSIEQMQQKIEELEHDRNNILNALQEIADMIPWNSTAAEQMRMIATRAIPSNYMKTTKSKRPARCLDRLFRRVRVDMGYGPAEHWVTAKVMDQRECQTLFGDGTTTDLLVELPGGERTWVSFWEEITEPNKE